MKPLGEVVKDKEPTLTVLVTLLIARSDGIERDKLITKLYHRLYEKFYNRCTNAVYKLLKNAPDWEDIRDDIFQESFITAFDKIHNFKLKDHWEDSECEKVLLYWLARIANIKTLNLIKRNKKEMEAKDAYQNFADTENSEGGTYARTYVPAYDKSKFDQVWANFNPMTKEIMLSCAENQTISECNTNHLPDEVIELLTAKYQVKPATIRKAKQRAIEALKKCKNRKLTYAK